jgi:hypothetical protein
VGPSAVAANFAATPSTCNLIAPDEIHTGYSTSERGWIYQNLFIETPLMRALLTGVEWHGPLDPIFTTPLARDPVLKKRLARVFTAMEHSALLQQESLLLSIAARLVTDHFIPGHSLREVGVSMPPSGGSENNFIIIPKALSPSTISPTSLASALTISCASFSVTWGYRHTNIKPSCA